MPFLIVIALLIAGLVSASDKLGITVIQLLIAIGFGIVVCGLILRKLKHDAKQQAFTRRRSVLLAKYGNDQLVDELMACSVLKGMPFNTLVDSIGAPVDEDHKVLKTKVRRTLKYGQTGVNRFDLRVIVEDDTVVGWQTQQPIGTANGFRPLLPGLPSAAYGNDVGIMQRRVAGPLTWIAWCGVGIVVFVSAGQIPTSTSQSGSTYAQQPSGVDASVGNPGNSLSASTGASLTPDSFAAGRDARVAFEEWIKTLSPQTRKGALWWAGERSKKTPHVCSGTGEFTSGCAESKLRLEESDQRRLSDPEFRRGWNSVSSD